MGLACLLALPRLRAESSPGRVPMTRRASPVNGQRNQTLVISVTRRGGNCRLFARLESNMDKVSSTPVLDRIADPADLRSLSDADLRALAEEIRQFLVATVSKTGGHLGPNLGVVELTLALHRVFESPRDRILWDTGHQAYVHKLLTR